MFLKICSTIVVTFAKALCVLMLAVLLTPIAFFAWRVVQPMSMPEYRGLNYVQFLSERRQGYDALAQTYQASHPNVNVKQGICFGSELAVEITFSWPVSGLYTLVGMVPSIRSHLNPLAIRMGFVPDHVTFITFLPTWWATFEKMVWGLTRHTPNGPVAYCRLTAP